MENIIYEHSIQWDEKKYKGIWSNVKRRYFKAAIFLIVGILGLFSSYTLIAGILIIIISIFGLFSPQIFSAGLKSNYKGHKYLHETLKYGVNETSLWVQGERIDAKCKWENLVTWQISGDWLILTPSGIPQVVFPIKEMKNNNVFEKVLEFAQKFATEFK